MPIDPIIKKVGDADIRSLMERTPGLSEAWQKGKIEDLIKFGIVGIQKEDLEKFASDQYKKLMEEVVKPDDIRAVEASAPPPMFEKDFNIAYDPAKAMTAEDRTESTKMIKGVLGGAKAQSAGASGQDYDQANSWLNDVLMPKVVEMQFQQQLEAKNTELQNELNKVLAMIKSGQIDDPAVLILALAKCNVEKGGLVFTQLGERMKNLNEQMSKATDSLKNDQSVANMTTQQENIRQGGVSMQLLTGDMQKVITYVDQWISTPKSVLDMIKTGKDEIIRKFTAQG